MQKIQIKPLSVNRAWRGRRFKTDDYKNYETELTYLLPKIKIPEGKLQVYYEFGVSSKLADWDNSIKQTQDILSKKYGFNDNRIYRGIVEKKDTKKGEEYIKFRISEYIEL